MLNRQAPLFEIAVGFILAMPLLASADPSHFAPTEVGVIYHPEHAEVGRSSAEVSAELNAAQTQANWDAVSRLGASPASPAGAAGMSRAQVSAELEAARQQPNWDAVSRMGAAPAAPKGDASKADAQFPR